MDSDLTFEQIYPTLGRWVQGFGWLEIGRDEYSRSMVRVLDEGGLVWEGETSPTSLATALADAEAALATWMREEFGER